MTTCSGTPEAGRASIVGTPGIGTLIGSAGDDRILGPGGIDVLSGGDGNDRPVGGAGASPVGSVLLGGNGADLLRDGGSALVLQGSFANARAAAQAVADNDALTAGTGVSIYNNSALGFDRSACSEGLGDGGAFSVLSNLTGQAGDAGVALLPTYTAIGFDIV